MDETKRYTLSKAERLNSYMLIEKLFAGGSKSFPAFPLRIVYMPVEGDQLPTVSLLISVPKKRFKRAVKRNLVKRQVREAFRKHKYLLTDLLEAKGMKLVIAMIWLDNEIHSSKVVEAKVLRLLQLTVEKLS